MKVLELDTQYRLAQILELATTPRSARSDCRVREQALDELIAAAARRFDLGGTRTLASTNAEAEAFDQSAVPETEAARALAAGPHPAHAVSIRRFTRRPGDSIRIRPRRSDPAARPASVSWDRSTALGCIQVPRDRADSGPQRRRGHAEECG